ncbi:MAG: phytanoyl-CoA dioxygenase family protein [Alphaproteobacteria bacterium]|nr:phytanoyl-CoA dioxygenase family protein [Alphaproteobacteria bacterium]
MISQQDVDFYHEQGYVVVKNAVEPEMLSRLRQAVSEILAGARGLTAHNDIYDLEPTHQPNDPRVRRIKTPHIHFSVFREFARYAPMVEVLKQLLGPSGVRLHGSKINIKASEYGAPVEWHQDWAFYPHTNDDLTAVGVMLDDCTLENGPLMIVPGSHRGDTFNHHQDGYFCGAMDPKADGIDYSKAVPLVAPAGSLSFHHVRVVHGSAQNTSSRSRTLLLYEFAAADAWPLAGVPNYAAFNDRLVAGEPTYVPRLTPVPVRMPMPAAPKQGSIYENQSVFKNKYFAITGEAKKAALT